MSRFSIIIPAYNAEKYINECIASCVDQTYSDIEVIVIDDGSTDRTSAIAKDWADRDTRVSVCTFTENKGSWSARKSGIEKAGGEYILFVDADDALAHNACEILYMEMTRRPVDILHFQADVINVNGLPEIQIEGLKKFLKPYERLIRGENVLLKIFREDAYGHTLWNKCFSAALCRKVLPDLTDAYITRSGDKLLYFILAYYAESYRGFKGEPLYYYYFGRGGDGRVNIDEKSFQQYCTMAVAADHLEDFLIQHKLENKYEDLLIKYRAQLLNDCIEKWLYSIDDSVKARCFDDLIAYWHADEVVAGFARHDEIDRYQFAKAIEGSNSIRFRPRPVRTIGTYFYSVTNGGTERVMCKLCSIWIEAGYQVILFTDTEKKDDEYELPEEVVRVVLPGHASIEKERYLDHAILLSQALEQYGIDVVVYHDWIMDHMLWDELLIKASGAAFIGHCHGVFCQEFHMLVMGYKKFVAPYLLADAVVTLSDVDRTFWSAFNRNVFKVINPFTYDFDDWKTSPCEGTNILWIGRISGEKRPLDALSILQAVLQDVPDAKLHVVGASKDPVYAKKFNKAIKKMRLENSVVLYGYQDEVRPYYRNSSVMLNTSEFEGYPLTLQEGMLAGLPVVMYELPWLTLTQNNPGIIAVKQQGIQDAARAIVQMLQNDEERIRLGRLSREYIEQYRNYDFKELWNTILNSVGSPHTAEASEDVRKMMETLIVQQDAGYQNAEGRIKYINRKTVRGAAMLLKVKDYLHEKGVKRAVKRLLKLV